jgi:hypothetical protein
VQPKLSQDKEDANPMPGDSRGLAAEGEGTLYRGGKIARKDFGSPDTCPGSPPVLLVLAALVAH